MKKPLKIINGILDYISDHTNDFVVNYEQIAYDDIKSGYTPIEVKNFLIDYCNKIITNLGTIIDIGCGNGYILWKLKAKEKIAIDIALTNLTQIPNYITRICCNAENIPLDDEIADYIICTDVFEHVQDEKKLSNEIKRLLKKGGKLILACPFKQDLSIYKTDAYIKNNKQYKYVHLRSIDDKMILENFKELTLMETRLIKKGMKYMKLKPYPIKIYVYEK
jgi:ubiquinone/menaquinone biosynthesis C-methylase UbiE